VSGADRGGLDRRLDRGETIVAFALADRPRAV